MGKALISCSFRSMNEPGKGWLPVRLGFDKCCPAFVRPHFPVHPQAPASGGVPQPILVPPTE